MWEWGGGWGGVGHVNDRLHLLREVDAMCGNGVGWGMLTFGCTCCMKLTLRVGMGWGGVGHVNVRLHLLHEVDATCSCNP